MGQGVEVVLVAEPDLRVEVVAQGEGEALLG